MGLAVTQDAKLPIIAFANTGWDALWMNRQHLLSRLAAGGHPVAYSTGTAHYSEFNELPLLPRFERRGNVVVMRKGYCLPRTDRLSPLARLSMQVHLRYLRTALGVARGQACVGMCFDPNLIDFIDMLAPPVRAFHIYDAYNRMTVPVPEFADLRRRIERFDMVTASSARMYEDVLGHPPDPRYIIPNGVDYADMLSGMDQPCAAADLIRALPGLRLGYTGTINGKIHLELVHALACARADVSVVMVGPVRHALLDKQAGGLAAYEALRAQPNVHFIDQVRREDVPAVLNAMDINCLFFRVDREDWVVAGYPLKLHEYLAIGKPVLSSPIIVVLEQFADVVEICDSLEQWLSAIDRVRREGMRPEQVVARRAVAARNDWNKSAAQMEQLLEQVTRDKLGRTVARM